MKSKESGEKSLKSHYHNILQDAHEYFVTNPKLLTSLGEYIKDIKYILDTGKPAFTIDEEKQSIEIPTLNDQQRMNKYVVWNGRRISFPEGVAQLLQKYRPLLPIFSQKRRTPIKTLTGDDIFSLISDIVSVMNVYTIQNTNDSHAKQRHVVYQGEKVTYTPGASKLGKVKSQTKKEISSNFQKSNVTKKETVKIEVKKEKDPLVLSKSLEKYYYWICKYTEDNARFPSYQEMIEGVDKKSKSGAYAAFHKLQEMGLLKAKLIILDDLYNKMKEEKIKKGEEPLKPFYPL